MEDTQLRIRMIAFMAAVAVVLSAIALALSGCEPAEDQTGKLLMMPGTGGGQTDADGGTAVNDGGNGTEEGGAGKDAEPVAPVLPEKDPAVTFEVPEGWQYRNEQYQNGPFGATWDTGSTIGQVERVNLQIHDIYLGDEKEAERIARERYDSRCFDPPCDPVEGWPASEFRIIELPGGTKLYGDIMATSIDKFRYSRDEQSPYSWGSDFTFSKNGYVFDTYFSDRPDLYIEEFDLITSTLQTEQL